MKNNIHKRLLPGFFLLIFSALMLCSIVSHAQIRYVKPVASGSGNGSSWANASSDLQAMINASPAGEEIWIAAGTYKPNRRADATGTITLNNRNNAFVLKEGVELYGGFIGTELFKHHRNYLLNIVILSGDIGIVGVSTDNCYHVVVSSGNTYQTVFDGITVQRGMANGASSITVNTYPISQKSGGGIYSMMDNVSFTNCIIQNNEALNTGGGLYDSLKAGGQSGYHTNCIITGNIAGSKGGGVYMGLAFGGLYDCEISNNSADEGGGIYSYFGIWAGIFSCRIINNNSTSDGGGIKSIISDQFTFYDNIISGNSAGGSGGGMHLQDGTDQTILHSCLFSGNLANTGAGIYAINFDGSFINFTVAANRSLANGGGIANNSSNSLIKNAIIYGNTSVPAATAAFYNVASTPDVDYSLVQGGYVGTRNINVNPLFVSQASAAAAPTIAGDYQLQKCSPALNAGRNGYLPAGILRDVIYNPRVNYGTVEMGAYEMQLQFAVPNGSGIVYVDNTKSGNGNSWANAVPELANALIAAKYNSSITQIWISKGTYKPIYNPEDSTALDCNATDRNIAFSLVSGVKVYGGFAGGETLLSQRNVSANTVTLSGDIGAVGVTTDNCYHVVISSGNNGITLLDGVSISSGNANASVAVPVITVNANLINPKYGGGLYKVSSATDITDCTIRRNEAVLSGGGIYEFSSSSSAHYSNCTITQNISAGDGGGLHITLSGSVFENCTISSNDASGDGAGMYLSGSGAPSIIDCVFSNNDATGNGGGFCFDGSASLISFTNADFSNNASDIEGGAVYITGTGSLAFTGGDFTGNTSNSNGAAICNRTTGDLNITNAVFSNNITQASGGAIYNNNSTIDLVGCKINNNQAIGGGNGGGISNTNTTANIYNCSIENNVSVNAIGGGIFHSGGYLVTVNSIYSGNQATATSAIYLNNNDAIIMNCLISGNRSTGNRPAINLQSSNTVTITGCTITGNKKQSGGSGIGIEVGTGSVLSLKNSIVWGNEGSVAVSSPISLAGGAITVGYSLIEGGYAGAGNINTNPLFIYPIGAASAPTSTGNYRLQKCSPAINTGSSAAVVPPGSFSDLDLNPRVDFTYVDMGAYEKHLAVPDANGIVYVDSSNVLNEGDGSSWDKAITEVADALKEAKLNTSVTQVWVAKGTYKPLYLPNADFSLVSCPVSNRDNTIVLVNNVKVYGGFAGGETDTSGRDFITNQTILNGDIGLANNNTDNCYHVVISSGAVGSASLNGFTVINGNANDGSTINVNGQSIRKDNGGGISNAYSSPVISNCIISGNHSSGNGGGMNNSYSSPIVTNCTISGNSLSLSGGGMNNYFSLPSLTNCIISGNSAFEGGGIYNASSSPTLFNCLISGNKTNTNGGGIYNYSTSNPVIINTTIAANKADNYGGGIFNSTSTPVLKNSIMWGNMSILAYSFVGVVSNCIIKGGHTGVENYDIDPLFVSPQDPAAAPNTLGDYRLQACSPALNLGDNSFIPPGVTKDLDSLDRIKFTTVDMGAYEKQDIDHANSTWKGVNTNWNDKVNWCGGYIPYDTTNVIIPSSLSNYPVINTGYNNGVKNILLSSGTSVSVQNTGSLTIKGTYTNSGSTINNKGKWVMAGSSASQSFPGTLATVSAMNQLEIKNPSGIIFNKSFSITGSLIPTSGSVNVNNVEVTLKSSDTATASVEVIQPAASISYTGTGSFIVERFINTGLAAGQHTKTWQFLATPTTGQTIYQSWQESGTTPAGFGTWITGTGTGFDATTALPSLKYFNQAAVNWAPVSNTGDALVNKLGYMLFVRGDRTVTTFNGTPNNTVMRSKGQLFSPANPAPSVPVTANKYQTFGNPYASRIAFSNVYAASTGINDVFYVWDPKLAGSYNVGGYQTISGIAGYVPTVGTPPTGNPATDYYPAGVPSPYIESGQAVFVKGNVSGGNVNFNENVKVTGSRLVNRPANTNDPIARRQFLFTTLFTNTGNIADGNIVAFEKGFGNVVNEQDAEKIMNGGENFGLMRNGSILAVEAHEPVRVTDTIFYNMNNLRRQPYQLRFAPVNMGTVVHQPFLTDRFTNIITPLSLTDSSFVDFNVTADAASAAADRFFIVFKMKGKPKFTQTANEIKRQEDITKSTNHTEHDFQKQGINIYPNPVINQEINIDLKELPVGKYKYALYNNSGLLVVSGVFDYTQKFSSVLIKPSVYLAHGIYSLKLLHETSQVAVVSVNM